MRGIAYGVTDKSRSTGGHKEKKRDFVSKMFIA